MPENNIENIAALRNSLRSEIVQEIVSSKPGFVIRWSIPAFFVVLICIGIACWVIKYPDLVAANAKLTSINAPKEVKSKIEGKLIKLNAAEGMFVEQGQLLGFMESQANPNEVIMLATIADTLQYLVENNKAEYISKYLSQPFQNLGEVQPAYQAFVQAFILFKQYLSSGYYLQKKVMLQGDIGYLQKLHSNLLKQKGLNEQDLNLSQKNFDANTSLNKDKVIADVEYRNENSKLISKKLTLPQIGSAIISNESAQHEKQKEILQLENEIAQQKAIFSQSLNTLKAQIEEWKTKYLLVAPVAGNVAFSSFMQEKQQLQAGQTVCFINPENTLFYAEIYVPQGNFGKVSVGQEVLLKFPSYPFQEYGSVKGKIDFISHIATDSGYLAKLILPKGLKTNYNKDVQYRDGLLAQAEIVTKDMRLLQRFYYSIIKQVKN